jgi:Tol biopolymer transport system component
MNMESGQLSGDVTRRAFLVAGGLSVLAIAGCSGPAQPNGRATGEASPSVTADELASFGIHADQAVMLVASVNSGQDIYTSDARTQNYADITNNGAHNLNPEVSPDGKRFVYCTDEQDGIYQIVSRSRTDLADRRFLTRYQNGVQSSDPVFTLDGQSVLFKESDEKYAFGDICRIAANDEHALPEQITPDFRKQGLEAYKPTPVDEHRFIFTMRYTPGDPSSDRLMLFDMRTGKWEPVIPGESDKPQWFSAVNPENGLIAFTSKQRPSKERGLNPDAIYTTEIGGDGLAQVSPRMTRKDYNDASWTRDGRGILCASYNQGAVSVIRASDQEERVLYRRPGAGILSPIIAVAA